MALAFEKPIMNYGLSFDQNWRSCVPLWVDIPLRKWSTN